MSTQTLGQYDTRRRGRAKGYNLRFFNQSEFQELPKRVKHEDDIPYMFPQEEEPLVPVYNLRTQKKKMMKKSKADMLYSKGYLGKTVRIKDAQGVQYYEKKYRKGSNKPYTYRYGDVVNHD